MITRHHSSPTHHITSPSRHVHSHSTIFYVITTQPIRHHPHTLTHTSSPGESYRLHMPSGWRRHWFFICLAGWWCANTIATATVTSVVWPAQISVFYLTFYLNFYLTFYFFNFFIQAIVDNPNKEDLYNGFIPSFGAFVSLVVTPVAGALSDYSTNRIGRRKIYIIVRVPFTFPVFT